MKSEEDLKDIIREQFHNDFRLYEEVEGEFIFEGEKRKVIADFVLAPNENLIEQYNFPKGFFIIETKFIKNNTLPELANLYIQCQTYKNSKFRNTIPFGVFHYTNLEYKFLPETKDSRVHEALLTTFGRMNIGRVEVEDQNYTLMMYKNQVFFKKKIDKYSKAKRNLLSISFGSGNNKIERKY